jgi:hypothetical protein
MSDYVLDDRAIEVRSPTGAEDFSSLCVQIGSGANPASYPVGTGGPFPGGKARPGRDADRSPPSSAEVKYEQELYLLSPDVPPWRVAGQLYFTYKELGKLHNKRLHNVYSSTGIFRVITFRKNTWREIKNSTKF